jgi:plastocyanin
MMLSFRHLAAASLLSCLGGPAAAQPAAQTILLSSFSYSPTPIHLKAGQPVTLTFVNRSGGGHDFTAKAFFGASRITAGAAPGGEIELHGHETRTITLIPQRGTYTAHCSHFLHTQMGMTDQIVVD